MKNARVLFDGLLVLLLIVLSVAALGPFGITMPNSLQMMLFFAAFGFVSAFVVLAWRERPADERETYNLLGASRLAYIAGCGVLIIALLVDAFRHSVDPAVLLALLVMIATKLGAQWFQDRK
jgi:cobalamin synthase